MVHGLGKGILYLCHRIIIFIDMTWIFQLPYSQCTRLIQMVSACSVIVSNSSTQNHLALSSYQIAPLDTTWRYPRIEKHHPVPPGAVHILSSFFPPQNSGLYVRRVLLLCLIPVIFLSVFAEVFSTAFYFIYQFFFIFCVFILKCF